MSLTLDPWHPGVLFLEKRLGRQFLAQIRLTLPPGSSVTLQTTPPAGMVWVIIGGTSSPPRDAATGATVIGDIYFRNEHPMIQTYTAYARESYYNHPWATNLEVSTGEPMVHVFTNASSVTVNWDFTMAIMECPERVYHEVYLRLWEGFHNFLYLLGGFNREEINRLVELLKALRPPTPPFREEGGE